MNFSRMITWSGKYDCINQPFKKKNHKPVLTIKGKMYYRILMDMLGETAEVAICRGLHRKGLSVQSVSPSPRLLQYERDPEAWGWKMLELQLDTQGMRNTATMNSISKKINAGKR